MGNQMDGKQTVMTSMVANAPHTSNTALQGMIIALGVDAETVQIIDSLEDLEAKQQCRDIIVSMCDAARTMVEATRRPLRTSLWMAVTVQPR